MAKTATKAPGTGIAARAVAANLATMTIAGVNFKVAKQLTMPLLKQKVGEIVYFTALGEHFVGKEIKAAPGEKKAANEKAADLILVKNLQDGREYHYIVNAILKGNLDEYPRNADGTAGYIGKSFAVHKLENPEGKRYKALEVLEITPE